MRIHVCGMNRNYWQINKTLNKFILSAMNYITVIIIHTYRSERSPSILFLSRNIKTRVLLICSEMWRERPAEETIRVLLCRG